MLSIQQSEVFSGKRPAFINSQPSSTEVIKQRALQQDIILSSQQMEVIHFVQDFYEHCDDCKNARQLMNIMHQEFADQDGRKHLYRLFPKGPLSTIHALIDLPDLNNQRDLGFGTSY